MEHQSISRRNFLRGTALAGAAFGFPAIIPATALGKNGKLAPSERVGIGVIACGSRAGYTSQYQRYAKSQIVAVCDPVKSRRDNFSKRYGNAPAYNDFRELLARKDVDAVHIATADHWHVPIAILAAKAGKDMYTEKPLGISIAHDIAARQIVDQYKRVFQYGAQQRSIEHVRRGIELVLNGHIGEVKEIPVHYEGTGRIPTEGLFNTLVTWDMTCTFANGLKMRFMDSETSGAKPPHPAVKFGHGTLFVGEKGWGRVARGGWAFSPKTLREKVKKPGPKRLKVSRDQIQNLVDCVISREEPVDNLHSAVRSDIISHLCEICVRTGRPITWDPEKETIVGDEEAAKRIARPLRAPWTLA